MKRTILVALTITFCLTACSKGSDSQKTAQQPPVTAKFSSTSEMPRAAGPIFEPLGEAKFPNEMFTERCSVEDRNGQVIFVDYVLHNGDANRGWLQGVIKISGQQRRLSATRSDPTLLIGQGVRLKVSQVGNDRRYGEDGVTFTGNLTLNSEGMETEVPVKGECYVQAYGDLSETNRNQWDKIDGIDSSDFDEAVSEQKQIAILKASWLDHTLLCRGGGVSEDIMMKACEDVEADYNALKRVFNQCYGKVDQPNSEHIWHSCDRDSL